VTIRHTAAHDRGAVLQNRYRVERRLGRGGMASAYLVHDELRDESVALKLLELHDARGLQSFRSEFALLSGLRHPHLLCVHDFGCHHAPAVAQHFYTATFVAGEALDRHAEGRPWSAIAPPLCDALEGLAFLHRHGIRHGDFKPQNILVDSDAVGTLIDLGCAAPFDRTAVEVSGTPAYLAPELFTGVPGDGRSDLYSVGVVLEELGRRASEDLPPSLRDVARRLLQRDPGSRPAEVADVLAALGRPQRSAGIAGGRSAKLVGRDEELALFERALTALLDGRRGSRALVWRGPASIGKSRLLHELKWRAQPRVTLVEGFSRRPNAVGSLLARACGTESVGTGVAAAQRALGRIERNGRPQLLLLDELERLDDDERRLFDALIRSMRPDAPLLVLAASRGSFDVDGATLEARALAPLSAAELSLWAADVLPESRIEQLHELSGGVPGYVEQILARLGSEGLSETELRRAAHIALSPDAGALDPAALAALDDDERSALGLLAALGGRAAQARWEPVIGAPPLVRLLHSGWIRREGSEWRLARAADASALLDVLSADQRRDLHGLIARILEDVAAAFEARGAEDDAAYERCVASLVLHGARAGERTRAQERFAQAWQAGRVRSSAWMAAIEALAPLIDDPELQRCLASALRRIGRPRRALTLIATIFRRRPSRRGDVQLCAEAGRNYLALAKPRQARRYLQRALDGDPRSSQAVATAEQLVRAHLVAGDYATARDGADAWLPRAAGGASEAGLLQSLGVAQLYLGDAAAAGRALRRAAELHDAAGSARERFRALSYLAILEYRRGDLAAATACYADAARLAEKEELDLQLANALLNLGTARQRAGDWGAALQHYERALRLSLALGSSSTSATLQLNLANLHAEIGTSERAVATLAQAEVAIRRAQLPQLEGTLQVVAAELASAAGERTKARELLQRAAMAERDRGAAREQAEVALHLAELELAAGRRDAAREQLGQAAERVDALEAIDVGAQLALLQGRLAVVEGRLDEAARLLAEAREGAVHAAQPLLLADVARARVELQERRGDTVAAARDRAVASDAWQAVAVTLPAPMQPAFWRHPRRAGLEPRGAAKPADAAAATPSATDRDARAIERQVLSRFLEVNRRINSSLAPKRVLELAIDAAIELTGAERGFVLIARRPGDPCRVEVARNLDQQTLASAAFEFSTGIAERVVREATSIITVDARRDGRFAAQHSVHAMQLQSVACVPIATPDGTRGALYLDNRYERGRFGEHDRELLEAFSTQVAIALRNAELHAELGERSEGFAREAHVAKREARGHAREVERLTREVQLRQRALESRYHDSNIVGRSAAMQRVFDTLDRIIDAPVPVLLRGESGTGKELVARAIHFNGPRRDGPFVTVNCAALPEQLLESELFGHVKGAFTGADRDKQGLMVAAAGGTLLLDEIGELPLPMQAKLLRAVQEREVRPVGGAELVALDIRLISATNRDLLAEVAEGRFREDLYYRLGVVDVELPPLRDRLDDVPALAQAIVARLARDADASPPSLSRAALRSLLHRRWPGNVRQLENTLARAYYMSDRQRIELDDLEQRERRAPPARARDREHFGRLEAERIVAALNEHRWNVAAVARALGIPRNTLYRKLRKHGLHRPAPA
jgi:transcriptional regulator with GAF, ATPase, and Fis domain/tetratricopeptide (TPR) repeat protein